MRQDRQSAAIVEAYLDLTSPYSYLASTQIERIIAGTGATFRWYPIIVTDLFPPGLNPLDGVSHQYDPDYRREDALAWAAHYKVPFVDPHGRLETDPYLLLRAAIAAGSAERRGAMMQRLFKAVFVDLRTRMGIDDVLTFALDVKLDPWELREAMANPMVEADRLAIMERANGLGVFGAPFFVTKERKFFGNDRLVLLTEHLLENAVL